MSGSQPISAPIGKLAPLNPLRSLRRSIRRLPLLRRLRRRVFTLCVQLLLGFVRRAPRGLVGPAMDALARLAWLLLPRERWIAERQLARAVGGALGEPQGLARASYLRLARNLVDGIRADRGVWIRRAEERRLLALASSDRPLLLLCAHLGAWELLGVELARRLPRFAVISAEPHNRAVGRILRESRLERGLQSFDRDREALSAARFLRRGGVLALLADHRSRAACVMAPFFGRPAPTLRAPFALARRLGATVLAVGIRSDAAGHRIVLGDELRAEERDAEGFARDCNAALERLILAEPLAWTWMHDRYGEAESA